MSLFAKNGGDQFGAYVVHSGVKNPSAARVSVVMAAYEEEARVCDSVESILEQSFKDLELVVVNDGSQDKTGDILKRFAEQDGRVVVIDNEENIGLTKSLVRAINLSRGEIIARQDADDVSLPERLEEQLRYFPGHDLVCCRTKVNNGKISPKWITTRFYRLAMPYRNPFIHGTLMFTKDIYLESGGFDPEMRYAQDYDFLRRILRRQDVRIKYLNKVLYHSRKHARSLSLAKRKEQDYFAGKVKQMMKG